MQLIKYQCRKCKYVFVQLHVDSDVQTAACPRCHHQDLIEQADFAAMPPPGLTETADCADGPTGQGAGKAACGRH